MLLCICIRYSFFSRFLLCGVVSTNLNIESVWKHSSETEQPNRNVTGSKCYSPRTIFALLIVGAHSASPLNPTTSKNAFTINDLFIDYCIVSINRMENNWLGD